MLDFESKRVCFEWVKVQWHVELKKTKFEYTWCTKDHMNWKNIVVSSLKVNRTLQL